MVLTADSIWPSLEPRSNPALKQVAFRMCLCLIRTGSVGVIIQKGSLGSGKSTNHAGLGFKGEDTNHGRPRAVRCSSTLGRSRLRQAHTDTVITCIPHTACASACKTLFLFMQDSVFVHARLCFCSLSLALLPRRNLIRERKRLPSGAKRHVCMLYLVVRLDLPPDEALDLLEHLLPHLLQTK